MRESAINVATAASLCACEVFLLSFGWNLSRGAFAQPELSILQAAGVLIVMKIVSSHVRPSSARSN